tara:strand:+ start:89 stop:1225 length:1137 start_codon:yes stop_codon:yes gene_type:complete
MEGIEKLLYENTWRFKKGYPDMGDREDVTLLEDIINSYLGEEEEDINIDVDDKNVLNVKKAETEETEETDVDDKNILNIKGGEAKDPPGGSKLYNDTIRYTLYGEDYKGKVIPKPKNQYQYQQNSFDVTVDPSDMGMFNKLFSAKPPKTGKEVGSAGSLGVGNGEIALYWLYHFSNSADVREGRSGDDPDLFFNGQGVEVKSWTKDSGIHGLGRFGADKENLTLLAIVFGFNALSTVFGKEGSSSKTMNPTNFNGLQLEEAMGKVKDFQILLNNNPKLAEEYPLFKTIEGNINTVYSKLNLSNDDSSKEMATKMAIKLLEPKLNRKPGDGNHLANVKDDGKIKFFQIVFSKLKESEDLLQDFLVKQSSININFDKIWG